MRTNTHIHKCCSTIKWVSQYLPCFPSGFRARGSVALHSRSWAALCSDHCRWAYSVNYFILTLFLYFILLFIYMPLMKNHFKSMSHITSIVGDNPAELWPEWNPLCQATRRWEGETIEAWSECFSDWTCFVFYSSDSLKTCEHERMSVLAEAAIQGSEERFVPECSADGRYRAVQCHSSTGYCWCVRVDTGRPVPGTSAR